MRDQTQRDRKQDTGNLVANLKWNQGSDILQTLNSGVVRARKRQTPSTELGVWAEPWCLSDSSEKEKAE